MANAKVDKLWAPAIRKAVNEYKTVTDENGAVQKLKYINILALQLVKAAADGDIAAMKEVGDRLDGKAPQSMALEHGVSNQLADLMREIDGRSRDLPS